MYLKCPFPVRGQICSKIYKKLHVFQIAERSRGNQKFSWGNFFIGQWEPENE